MLVVLLFAAVACTGADASPQRCAPRVDESRRPRPAQAAYEFCAQVIITGQDGVERLLQVGLISDQASDPLRQRKVLVYHPGGPGISAVQTLFEDPPPIDLGTYTIVSWDGATAATTSGGCGPASSRFGTERSPKSLGHDAVTVANECFAALGSSSEAGAWVAAEELERVRLTLGVDTVDLLMHSYGATIAEAYLRRYSGSVGRALLDGPLGLDAPWRERITAVRSAIDAVGERLLAFCAKGNCPRPIMTAVGEAVPTHETLRDSILAAKPRVGSGDLTLTPTILDQATLLAMRSRKHWPGYFAAVEKALDGNGSSLWTIGERYFIGVDRPVFYASICHDLVHPETADGYRVAGERSPLATYVSELAPCAGIPRIEIAPPQAAERSEAEVLVLTSRYDVVAPAGLLDSGTLPGRVRVCETGVIGHTSYGSGSFKELVDAFLEHGLDVDFGGSCARAR